MGDIRGVLGAGAGICAVTLFAAVPAWGCATVTAPYLNALEPNKGAAGIQVIVSGGNWAPNQSVALSWRATGQHLGTATSSGNGSFASRITIPLNAPVSGSDPDFVRATQGNTSKDTPFRVDQAAPTTNSNSKPPPEPEKVNEPAGATGGPPPSEASSPSSYQEPPPPPDSPRSDGGDTSSAPLVATGGRSPSAASSSGAVAGSGAPGAVTTTTKAGAGAAAPGAPAVSSSVPADDSGPEAAEAPAPGDPEPAEPGSSAALDAEAAGRSGDEQSFGPLGLVLLAGGVVGSLAAGMTFSQWRRRRRLVPPE